MSDQEPSRDLVEEASRGVPAAVERLLELHWRGLSRFLRGRASDLVLARETDIDLVQSVCREALERLRDGRFEWQGEAAFKQWLYQAALLKLKDRRDHWLTSRRDVKREVPERTGETHGPGRPAQGGAAQATPSEDAAVREEAGELADALARLDEADRRIIELARFEGLSHTEIAQRLGVTEATSRQRLGRALARLTTERDALRRERREQHERGERDERPT